MAHQRQGVVTMLAGMGVIMTGILVGAAFNAPDPVIITGAGGMIAWAVGMSAWMARHATGWKRAHDVITEWDRRQLVADLGELEPTRVEEPDDPRWQNIRTLIARIRELAGDDSHVVEVAGDVEGKLRGLLEDQATLREAIEADAALGGDSEGARARTERLRQALEARSATSDRLVEAIRDLHVELAVRDASTDPLVDRLESLLSQVEAEAEVVSVGSDSERAEKARLARARQSAARRE